MYCCENKCNPSKGFCTLHHCSDLQLNFVSIFYDRATDEDYRKSDKDLFFPDASAVSTICKPNICVLQTQIYRG